MAMSKDQQPGLSLHPDYQVMLEEAGRLRAELTALLLQKEDLQTNQSRRIEAAYLRKFGALELRTYEAYCSCLRAKRKAALIRASLNRREPVDPEAVEAALDRELAGYRSRLQEKMELVARIQEPGQGDGMTARGRTELKTCYRAAIKALHPDLHPDSTPEQRQLLQKAVNAYKHRDLKTLRAVCDTLGENRPVEEETDLEALQAEIRRLRSSVRRFSRELEELKSTYPYTMRVFLENEEMGEARKAELLQKLEALQKRTRAFESGILDMLRPEEGEEA